MAAVALGAGVGVVLGVTELLAAGVGVVLGDDAAEDDADVAAALVGDDSALPEPPLQPLTAINEHNTQSGTSRRTPRA